jgi:ABC-type phosphate/phosphonate transport system substrate-binding protein
MLSRARAASELRIEPPLLHHSSSSWSNIMIRFVSVIPGKALVGGALFLFQGTLLVPVHAQEARHADMLHIGTSGSLAHVTSGADERTAIDTLKLFIKDETGFANEIIQQKDWNELADKMANGQLHIGVFPGFEFAWAKPRYPGLKPLALAVNGHLYRYVHVLARQDNKAGDFAGLQGQSLALPTIGWGELNLFVEQTCQQTGKPLKAFFAKVSSPNNFEDAIDDVVDGIVQVTVVDRVGMEAYKRRKPGRFQLVKEITQSAALPPPIVAYYEAKMTLPTLKKFEHGLLNASYSERGLRVANLFRLTGFKALPPDFDKVVAETLKNYPPAAR